MKTKYCSRCEQTKNTCEFGVKKTEQSGYQLWCKICTRSYYNEWRVSNREKSKSIEVSSFKRFYGTIHGRAVHMLNNARARAKRNNILLSITVEWIEDKLISGKCEVTGIPFILQENHGKGHRVNSFSPSIDRINQTGGYTPENCQMTCWIYNRAKGAFPLEDLHLMLSSLNLKP